jgi:hypothetical protein
MILSIIIPVGPGEPAPAKLLAHLQQVPGEIEILIPTAGSVPWTVPEPVRQIESAQGRGHQLNTAARQAAGRHLWFVHSDCSIAATAAEKIMGFLDHNDAALGYCRLHFADDGPTLTRLNAGGANLRSRWFGLPYGDQGLCLPRDWFERLGGFREDLNRGEDLDLVVRAKLAGLPVRPMDIDIETSARRYREQGWLKTTIKHQVAAIALIRQARRKALSQ